METVATLKKKIDDTLKKPAGDVSIIAFVELIAQHAYASRASDIHIDPADDKVVVRERVDGMLHEAISFPKQLQSEVVSRIKVLSGLKTDIHQIPQDGRFKVKIEGRGDVDVRVSMAPTYYGENVVMRILADSAKTVEFTELGFTPAHQTVIEKSIQKPYGMVLTNGPTGSGKTTTLYTMVKKLNAPEVSIVTIEEPIEYSVPGVTQMPVNNTAGFTFASGLRSILRQDPNIIMVGEIRDSETASIAINAALTGHLVFSTLHTNDAATTFPRLTDMGAPPFLLASTLNVAIAQRLVRIVCPNCRKQRTLGIAELKSISGLAKNLLIDKVWSPGPGCETCEGKSYKGRIGIYEVLEVNDEIRELIVSHADASQIKQQAIKNGMKTMIEDGLLKARDGITTIEEVLRIVYE
jgi:type II secretory ATPase GspE/PulE/Tfp pilus assembly ATPase PilB-like protein